MGNSRVLRAVAYAAAAVLAGGALLGATPPAQSGTHAPPPGTGNATRTSSARPAAGSRFTAAPAAAGHASGALSTVALDVVHGGYVAAGVAMRNLGYGTIAISGIPSGATVRSAILMWNILAGADQASFGTGSIGGHPVRGTYWASGASPCWPTAGNFSYEADVTKFVSGNGKYPLTGFATGESDGLDPATQSAPPMLEGASLIVVYELRSRPQTVIQIGEGAAEFGNATASATMDGFIATGKPQAATTWIVADGQTFGAKSAAVNGVTVPGVTFGGTAPQAVPGYTYGNLWDTMTASVSPDVRAGSTSATLSVTSAPDSNGSYDCLVWVGQVLSVRQAQVGIYSDFKAPAKTASALNDGWTLLSDIAGLGHPKTTPDRGYRACGAPWVGATGSDMTLARQVRSYNATHIADITWISYWTPAVPPAGVNLRAAGRAAGAHAAVELSKIDRATGLLPSSVVLDFEPSDTGTRGHPSVYSCGKNRLKGQKKPVRHDKQCWRWVNKKVPPNCFVLGWKSWREFARGWALGVTSGVEDLPVSAAIYVSGYEYGAYHVAAYNVPVVLAVNPIPAKPRLGGLPIVGYAAFYARCGAALGNIRDMASWDADFSSLQFTARSLVCKP